MEGRVVKGKGEENEDVEVEGGKGLEGKGVEGEAVES